MTGEVCLGRSSNDAPMGPILRHDYNFCSVYGHESLKYPGTGLVTSFHDRSEETLDYIFYSSPNRGNLAEVT